MALVAVEGEKTFSELVQDFDMHRNEITTLRSQLLEGAAGVLRSERASEASEPAVDVKTLHAKISELTLANDFFVRGAREGWSVAKGKAMIDRSHFASEALGEETGDQLR